MRHVRMLGLCLVAALALGAYAVSSASALEWGKCEFIGSGGNYTGPNCNKHAGEKAKPKGSGSYEWRKASEVAEKRVAEGKSANVPFSGESSGGGGVLTSVGRDCDRAFEPNKGSSYRTTRQACAEEGGKEEVFAEGETTNVECAKENNTGETEGKNKVANVNVVFTGCAVYGSVPCYSEGAEEGEIATNTLKGKLGWINKSTKEVGVLLEPASGKHGAFAEFNCAFFGIKIRVGSGNKKEGAEYVLGEKYPEGCYGLCPGATPSEEKHGGYNGIISPITPVNVMTNEFTQVYTQEAEYPHKNIPSSFENKHLSVLEDYIEAGEVEATPPNSTAWSAAGEVVTNVNTPEEEGEIRA